MSLHFADLLKALTAVHQIAQVVEVIAPTAAGAAKLDAAVTLAEAVAPALKDTLGGLAPLRAAISAVVDVSKAAGGSMAPSAAVSAPAAPVPVPA